jgi:Carboxylesterase family
MYKLDNASSTIPTEPWIDNSHTLALNSPPLVNRYPAMCRHKDWSPRQYMVNRILTDIFYHCPAEWMSGAVSAGERRTWRYEIRHEQNIHGDQLELLFPSSDDFNPEDGKYNTRMSMMCSLQKVWGNFITQDSPVISLHDARGGNELALAPTDPHREGEREDGWLYWPQYPWMMVLDTGGGETTMQQRWRMGCKCPTRGEREKDDNRTSFYNRFSLANSELWNKDRGARCQWWQGQAHKIPL